MNFTKTMGAFSLFLFSGLVQTASLGQSIVLPAAWEQAEAPSSSTLPFGSSSGVGRYQQVFEATELQTLPVPCWITAVAFRANQNAALSARSMQGSVRLSSPIFSPDALSTTFAENAAPDVVETLAGSWSFPDVPASAGPASFLWRIEFARPFRYEGNGILLDMTIDSVFAGGASGASLDAVSVTGDSVSRAYNSTSSTASKGSVSTLGLIARFEFAPWTPLFLTPGTLSLAQGGQSTLTLDAGYANGGRSYLVLGSFSGTAPGWTIGSVPVPLNFDRITWNLWFGNGISYFQSFSGVLDPLGRATAQVQWPGPMNPALSGKVFDFAFVLTNPVDWASNAASLSVLP